MTIWHICKHCEVFETFCQVGQLKANLLKIAMVEAHELFSRRITEAEQFVTRRSRVLLGCLFWPVLAVHQRIVNEWTILSLDYVLVCEALNLGKVHILSRCLNGLHANITADYLNVQIALDFP